MSIWYRNYAVADLDKLCADTAVSYLDIRFAELGEDFVSASMPVDARTVQPMRVLHGGASCLLAETLGSVASNLVINPDAFYAVGAEINASHLRPATRGRVTGIARPIRLGSSQHVWDIRIENEAGGLVCIARLTNVVRRRRDSVERD
ncbi:1,4-dihydroxy-2-naphthoyl-CoA hydrolase [Andreprevotia lacus DSM 23236]|jgi:1,4-dihydroxy-2-naphthoyl-CoA hydrolase|uniref:1,4-dihydroxy-2-naphthoyl-CoA hydrolase n=1 Tax=Andreprevotia lacus DSM 23236 TaxID=1121001 RepID=A0A1W1WWE8_9NEIS|nr:hotdog fold thioesterase [Andreprevotia lacus]SMC16049.1 1,4-dihydroxy-2-naphthoyl-CoA hydrolase [Andreprevotia lacus DSM 23236]